MMLSVMNPNRFLRSISPAFRGNPQPTRAFKKRMQAMLFNSTRRKGRKVRQHKIWIAKSNPFWRKA